MYVLLLLLEGIVEKKRGIVKNKKRSEKTCGRIGPYVCTATTPRRDSSVSSDPSNPLDICHHIDKPQIGPYVCTATTPRRDSSVSSDPSNPL